MIKKTTENVTEGILRAISASQSGIANLEMLDSLRLCSRGSLLATLCRLGKQKRIIRLKRGAYSTNPIQDGYAAAQVKFAGYIGFASALRLHGLIAEEPFTIIVVTPNLSKTAQIENMEFRAVALGNRAFGTVRIGRYNVSSKAKTLFDCLFLPHYSVPEAVLAEAYSHAGMKSAHWREFNDYAKKFGGRKKDIMLNFAKRIRCDKTNK